MIEVLGHQACRLHLVRQESKAWCAQRLFWPRYQDFEGCENRPCLAGTGRSSGFALLAVGTASMEGMLALSNCSP